MSLFSGSEGGLSCFFCTFVGDETSFNIEVLITYFTMDFEHYFNILIQSAGSFYWAICVILLFLKVPATEGYLPYRKAKRCLAATYFIMGVNVFAWLAISNSEDWKVYNPYIRCSDYVFFYLESIFFFTAFGYLMNPRFVTWRKMVKDWVIFFLSSIVMVLSLTDTCKSISLWMSVVAVLAFFVQVVTFLHRFYYLYDEKRKALDNYFAEDMQLFMFWIKKSLFFIVMTGVLSFSTLLFGLFYNYLFQAYVISANFYIGISFINYARRYGELNQADVTEKDRTETHIEEQKNAHVDNYEQLFGEQVTHWLEEKKYLSPQLTIDDLATEMRTNKLYMSRYINSKYGVNFSTWITQMRLEEAKDYMMKNPNVKQEEVAFHSGFSSGSYFSKVFSRVEGMTPAAWRKRNNHPA